MDTVLGMTTQLGMDTERVIDTDLAIATALFVSLWLTCPWEVRTQGAACGDGG